MSSSEVKPEDKSIDEPNSGLKAENASIKDKCAESVKETETNGTIDNKSADSESGIYVSEAETGNATVDQKPTKPVKKPPDTQKDQKAEEQQADEIKNSPQEKTTEKTLAEPVVGDVDDTQKTADSEDGKKERETTEKKHPLGNNESDQKSEKEKTSTAQVGLPKWMVQDANAPPSPSPEVDGNIEQLQSSASPQKGRGRGRGRRPAAEKLGALKDKTAQSTLEDTASQRPRRSTRTSIDYANPDAVTVLAEVDDEELSGTSKRQKGVRPVQDKGIKRKTTGTSEDEVREDDDDDLDYGAKKKKKRVGTGSPGKRGRPAGSKSKNLIKPTKSTGRPKRGKNTEKDSEDDDAEVVYDDRASEKEQTSEDEFEATKPSPNKMKTSVQAKLPAKKRGRPPGRRQTQQSSADGGKTSKNEANEKTKVDEESTTNQQTINVEA